MVPSAYVNMQLILHLLAAIGFVTMALGQQQFSPECQTRPNEKSTKECCKAPRVIPPRDKFPACLQKFPKPSGPPPVGSFPLNQNCFAQCMFEELGIVVNGVLNKDAASSKMVAIVSASSSELGIVAKNAVEACFQVSPLAAQKDSLGCSMMAGSFLDCIPSMMFLNCPASAWTGGVECDQLKAHLQKGCPFMTLVKPPSPPS